MALPPTPISPPASPPPAAAPAAVAPAVTPAPPAPPAPTPQKGNWVHLVLAIVFVAASVYISSNDKEVSLAQISAVGKGEIPALPARPGSNINVPIYKEPPAPTPPPSVAFTPSLNSNDGDSIRRMIAKDGSYPGIVGNGRGPVKICANPGEGTKILELTGDAKFDGGKVMDNGNIVLSEGQCGILHN